MDDKARESRLKRLYGITIAEYDARLAAQGGGCAGCGWKPKPHQRKLHVEHNHRTGKVRMLACWKCNQAIKKLRDSSRIAYNIARYLEAAGD